MAIIIGDNFNYQGKQSNFIRDSFETLAAMKAYPETSLDEGHRSYCKETKKYYEYHGSNSIDSVLGKWRLLTDTALSESSENPVQNKVITAKFNQITEEAAVSLETINTQLEALKEELLETVSDSEEVSSAAFGYLKKEIDSLDEILGQALSEVRNVMVTNDVTINGHPLLGDIVLDKRDVGLDKVDNTSDSEKPISGPMSAALNGKVDKVSGKSLVPDTEISKLQGLPNSAYINIIRQSLSDHLENLNNPHEVTAEQVGAVPVTRQVNGRSLDKDINITAGDVGLSNVNNTSDKDKPISTATQTALNQKVDKVSGKELISTTNLNKLAGIEEGAEKNTVLSVVGAGGDISEEDLGIDISSRALGSLEERVNDNEKTLSAVLNDFPRSVDVKESLDQKVDKAVGKSLVDDDQIQKLTNLPSKTELDLVLESKADNFTINGKQAKGEVVLDGADINVTATINFDEESVTAAETLQAFIESISEEVIYLIGWNNELSGQKQDKLVSGESIKTINGESVLGKGDLIIKGTSIVDALGFEPVDLIKSLQYNWWGTNTYVVGYPKDITPEVVDGYTNIVIPYGDKNVVVMHGESWERPTTFTLFKGATDYYVMGASGMKSFSSLYHDEALETFNCTGVDTSNVTDMWGMFYGCSSLTSLDLSSFDTSNVVDNISSTFYGCSSLTSLDLSSFDTSKVAYMEETFYGCSSLTSLDLSSFDTSNVIKMSSMFYNCSLLTSLNAGKRGTLRCSVNFSDCPKLTQASVDSIIDWLHDYTADGATTSNILVLHKTVKAAMTDAQKQAITNKGWTLA